MHRSSLSVFDFKFKKMEKTKVKILFEKGGYYVLESKNGRKIFFVYKGPIYNNVINVYCYIDFCKNYIGNSIYSKNTILYIEDRYRVRRMNFFERVYMNMRIRLAGDKIEIK